MVAPTKRRNAATTIEKKTLPSVLTILDAVPPMTVDDAPIEYASPEVEVITKQGRKFVFISDYTSAGGTYIQKGTRIYESDLPLGLTGDTGISRKILELLDE
jgi:hypothetical protein